MPWLNTNKFATKLRKVCEEHMDGSPQDVLKRMVRNPQMVRNSILRGDEVRVRFVGESVSWLIGKIEDKNGYLEAILDRSLATPVSLSITGGGKKNLGCNIVVNFKPQQHEIPTRVSRSI